MPRFLRICLMVFGPTPIAIASIYFWVIAERLFDNPSTIKYMVQWSSSSPGPGWESILSFLWVISIVYLLGAIPSLGYMACMELAISEGLESRSWKLVGLSTFLGLLIGLCVSFAFEGSDVFGSFYKLAILGAWVGFATGLLIKFMPERLSFSGRSRKKRKHPREILHD